MKTYTERKMYFKAIEDRDQTVIIAPSPISQQLELTFNKECSDDNYHTLVVSLTIREAIDFANQLLDFANEQED